MTDLIRHRVDWTGFPGGPGLSTFYSSSTGTPLDLNPALKTFFEALKTNDIPSTVSIQYRTVADVIDVSTGKIIGTQLLSAQSATAGSGTNIYSAPSGIQVRWNTAGIVDGRRVRGRTFLVPITGDESAGGQPSSSSIARINAAAAALIATSNGNLLIWSRPFAPKPPANFPPARVGTAWTVLSAVAVPKFAVLTSRRD